jgi:pilus assembly protein CpaF
MVLMADVDLPVRVIRDQIASAIDLVVQLARLKDGTRRVVSITEVAGMEGEVITMQDVFAFDYGAGRDERGRYLGELRFTGLRPKFFADLADLGVTVPTLAFGQDRVTAKGRP